MEDAYVISFPQRLLRKRYTFPKVFPKILSKVLESSGKKHPHELK